MSLAHLRLSYAAFIPLKIKPRPSGRGFLNHHRAIIGQKSAAANPTTESQLITSPAYAHVSSIPLRIALWHAPNASGIPPTMAIVPTAASGWPQQYAIRRPTPTAGRNDVNRASLPVIRHRLRVQKRL